MSDPMQPGQPKWRRRSEARPGEIIEAALVVFSEKGFAAARLDDIAARAGVSKGALYLYFETKQDLFRAVVRETIAPNLAMVAGFVSQSPLPFGDLIRLVFARIAEVMTEGRLGAVAKMVIGESRNFPELARIWRERSSVPMLAAMSGAVRGPRRAARCGRAIPGSTPSDHRAAAGQRASGARPSCRGGKPFDLEALLAQHSTRRPCAGHAGMNRGRGGHDPRGFASSWRSRRSSWSASPPGGSAVAGRPRRAVGLCRGRDPVFLRPSAGGGDGVGASAASGSAPASPVQIDPGRRPGASARAGQAAAQAAAGAGARTP
jgi:AcrR family transcriptional regulator